MGKASFYETSQGHIARQTRQHGSEPNPTPHPTGVPQGPTLSDVPSGPSKTCPQGVSLTDTECVVTNGAWGLQEQ